MNRKGIEQFVAEKNPAGSGGVRDPADHFDAAACRIRSERFLQSPPHRRSRLDDSIDDPCGKVRVDLAQTGHDIPREATIVSTLLHDERMWYTAEGAGPFIMYRPGEKKAERFTYRNAGVKVTPPANRPRKRL